MTGREFLQQHGDPAGWTDTEYEQYGQIATPGRPVPPQVIAYLKQPPATKVEQRTDGSTVLHITPAPTAAA